MSEHTQSGRSTAARHLQTSAFMSWAAWLAMTVLEGLLYARETPLGGPYVDHWDRYFFHASLFNYLAITAVSLPFWLYWGIRPHRLIDDERARACGRVHKAQLALLVLLTVLDHSDNEVMRFMGTHLSLGLLTMYGRVDAWGSDLYLAVANDEGGPWLPFVLVVGFPGAMIAFGRWELRRVLGPGGGRGRTWPAALSAAAVVVPLGLSGYAFLSPGGSFRKQRTQPALFTLVEEIRGDLRRGARPDEYERLVADYQRNWLAESGDAGWTFDDPQYPFVRTPVGAWSPASSERWNFIYLQLETFRGWEMGFHRPELDPSPTPFLDSLAADPDTAHWPHNLSPGPPTVGGFMAGHCSVRPHSRDQIITDFTWIQLRCLPSVLREHGYRTELFTASDPDWDNEAYWLDRWYDQYHFLRDANEEDRLVFRAAGERIRELGRGEQPFMATVVSISNHYPFHSREAALDIAPNERVQDRIRNTTHYTDDVVREFMDSLASEPWFARTIVVVVGDHGYELGESTGMAGRRTGRHEGTWVPLLIHGRHPALPTGAQPEVSSLLDVAPTLAALAGIREKNPWIGHSLIDGPRARSSVTNFRPPTIFAEDERHSLVLDPDLDRPELFDAGDLLQRSDLYADEPEAAEALLRRAREEAAMLDYALELDRVWPAP